MKKIRYIIFIIFVLFGITVFYINNDSKLIKGDFNSNENIKELEKAFFFSYLDMETYLKGEDVTYKKNIDIVINNMKKDNFNLLVLHVRPFSDSIYPSKYFPLRECVDYVNFDVLDYFIKKAHENNIKVHAWINPYRISSSKNFVIKENHPAYKFIGTNNIKTLSNGIYYNPASSEVTNLIVDGIKEIVSNYDVDGVCFDDYFYPGGDIDQDNYALYKSNGGTKSLKDYRLEYIRNMISIVYSEIKKIDKDVVFGISPQGNIDNNYNDEYLDIKYILANEGYVDYIMPQIYFGFDNGVKPFMETVEEWQNLVKVKDISLIPALALYKSGNIDKYAGIGKEEWINNKDVIKREIEYLNSKNLGFILFRYENFYNPSNDNMKSEVSYIKETLKK